MIDEESKDDGIAQAVRNGNREAFNEWVSSYQRRVFGLVMMMLRDPVAAEEVTQESFIRAFTHLDMYDPHRPFYPWLATIAVRLSQNWQRRNALRRDREEPLEEASEPSGKGGQEQDLHQRQTAQTLWETVGTLPLGERTAIFMFYRQDMKVDEIAKILGVSTGTVKTMLFRARQKLRGHARLKGMDPNHTKEEPL